MTHNPHVEATWTRLERMQEAQPVSHFMHAGDTAVVHGTCPVVCVATCTHMPGHCRRFASCEEITDSPP